MKTLDRELKVPRTFAHFRSEEAHAPAGAQRAKSFLAVWNRPKVVLQTLGKLASRLQALGGERKVCRTFAQVRMSRFVIKFCGDLEDQPLSVVVSEGCQEAESPGSILGGCLQSFLFL